MNQRHSHMEPVSVCRRRFLEVAGLAWAGLGLTDSAVAATVDLTRTKMCADKFLTSGGEAATLVQTLQSRQTPNMAMRSLVGRPMHGSIEDPKRLGLHMLKLWNDRKTLRVKFIDRSRSGVVEDQVRTLAPQWEPYCGLKFDFLATGTNSSAEIRITLRQLGHYSYIGTDCIQRSQQAESMNLQLGGGESSSEFSRVILHEFGHAIGCVHEHSTQNSEIPWDQFAVMEYYKRTQGWEWPETYEQVIKRYSKDMVRASKWDPTSIMQYPIDPSLVASWFRDQALATQHNTQLSQTDKVFIAQIYGIPLTETTPAPKDDKKPNLPTTLLVDAPMASAELQYPGEIHIYAFDVTETGFYTIETDGFTHVNFVLSGPNDITANPQYDRTFLGSRDFINPRFQRLLATGRYFVTLGHVDPQAGGKYQIGVAKGRK